MVVWTENIRLREDREDQNVYSVFFISWIPITKGEWTIKYYRDSVSYVCTCSRKTE